MSRRNKVSLEMSVASLRSLSLLFLVIKEPDTPGHQEVGICDIDGVWVKALSKAFLLHHAFQVCLEN